MINYSKYALMLENKVYEATYQFTTNTAQGIAKVLSGKDYAMYEPQWNQFFDKVETKKKSLAGKDGAGVAMIKHDDGRDMVAITFDIKGGKLDWMSLRCGVPEQRISTIFPGYKGATSVFTPEGKLEGSADQGGQQSQTDQTGQTTPAGPIPDSSLQTDVDTLVEDLDGYVAEFNLNSILGILKKYVGKTALKDDDTTPCDAIGRLMLLYKRDESGNTLTADVDSIGSTTFSPASQKNLSNIKKILAPYIGKEENYA